MNEVNTYLNKKMDFACPEEDLYVSILTERKLRKLYYKSVNINKFLQKNNISHKTINNIKKGL
jgi:hypothetical protein